MGKTSVVRRLTNNYFPKTDPSAKQDQSVGISYQFKKMRLKGETILLQVWDAERVDSEIVGDMSSTDHHLSRVRGAAIILDVMQLKHLDKYLRKRVEAIKEQNGAEVEKIATQLRDTCVLEEDEEDISLQENSDESAAGTRSQEMSGFLNKRSHAFSGSKRRFFLLQSGTLLWYKSENDPNPCGFCHLADCHIVDEFTAAVLGW